MPTNGIDWKKESYTFTEKKDEIRAIIPKMPIAALKGFIWIVILFSRIIRSAQRISRIIAAVSIKNCFGKTKKLVVLVRKKAGKIIKRKDKIIKEEAFI